MEQRAKLRMRVWTAMHDYYWDRAKLLEWYRRLSSLSTEDVSDIEKGMAQYPDLELIRIKSA
jgi:hypothetical protein